jgi:hypothetical protein
MTRRAIIRFALLRSLPRACGRPTSPQFSRPNPGATSWRWVCRSALTQHALRISRDMDKTKASLTTRAKR